MIISIVVHTYLNIFVSFNKKTYFILRSYRMKWKKLKFAMSQPIFLTSQNLWSSALHLCFPLPFVRNSCTCQQLVALVDGQLLLSNKLDWRETFSVELFRFFPSLAGIFSFRKSDRSFIEALSNAGLVLLGAHFVKFSHNDHLRGKSCCSSWIA